MRAADKEQSVLQACSGGGWRSRARAARRAHSEPRTPWQRGAGTDECHSRSTPMISWSTEEGRADTCAGVRVPPSKRDPRARARCGAGDVSACLQREMTRLRRVLTGRCGQVHGPSAARTAHERALGWDGAEAYSRRQQSVKRYPRTVARWWSSSSPLERGGDVHVPPAKHES